MTDIKLLLSVYTPSELAKAVKALEDERKVYKRKAKRSYIVLGIDMKPLYTGLTQTDAKALKKHIAGGCVTTEKVNNLERKGRRL